MRYLLDHPGQLVTKAALLDAVWSEVSVSDSMPATCVTEIRRALGDDAKTPRFIETVHRRGYRFIANGKCCNFEGRGRRTPREELSGEVSGRQFEELIDELILYANISVADPPRLSLCIMCIASYPLIVRRTTRNSRKLCLTFTRRLIAR